MLSKATILSILRESAAQCGAAGNSDYARGWIAAHDAMEKRLGAAEDWRDANADPPQEPGYYFVAKSGSIKKHVYLAYWSRDLSKESPVFADMHVPGWCVTTHTGEHLVHHVTHWMPAPPLPEGNNNVY